MRSRFKTVIAALVAVFAFGAVAASAASAETAAEQQQFENAAGHEPTLKGFTSTSGVVVFRYAGEGFECKKATTVGKLVGKESVDKVVVTFTGCQAKLNSGEECKVKSKGAKGPEEIVTNSLKGELGEVATTEATSGVGLLLEGEASKSNVIATLEAPCFPAGGGAMEGSVVGEVTPLTLGFTDKVVFALNAVGGEQKIRTFERSFAQHCASAPAARQCKEDFSFKPKLEVFTKAATFESKDENKFQEELKVNAGV